MISPDLTFDGYRILRQIGAGGFGEIWVCQSEALGDFRAFKFIPSIRAGCLDKEFHALSLYRSAAGRLRSPALMPVEHANLLPEGLFYVMPLADGVHPGSPLEEQWQPKTLSALLARQATEPGWFSSRQIKEWMGAVLNGLQLLSEAGLVHRDVKPDNILFLNDTPCLSDISLLGEDTQQLTRRGTPGFSSPSWFEECGGHPDMYGAAMTLYALLSGNPPDKMGRANFRWPPQGEKSLSPAERTEWLKMHAVVRRAVDERPAERFADFSLFARALTKDAALFGLALADGLLSRYLRVIQQNGRASVLSAGAIGFGLLFLGFQAASLGRQGMQGLDRLYQLWENGRATGNRPPAPDKQAAGQAKDAGGTPEAARAEIQEFEAELSRKLQLLTFSREKFALEMDSIAADLFALDPENDLPPGTRYKPLSEIKDRFLGTLRALPPKLDLAARGGALAEVRSMSNLIGNKYGSNVRAPLEEKILRLESELNSDAEFRKEQGMKVLKNATKLVNIRPESWDIIRPAQNFTFFGEP